MKQIFAFLILLSPLTVVAQSGSITYEQTVKIDIELPPEMESMRDQIPSEQTMSKLLLFSEMESLMKAAPKEEDDDQTVTGRGGGMMIRMGGGNDENETYINLDEGTVTEKRDFMGRTFLIAGDQPLLPWKLTGEQSEYAGFAVQKATAVRDSSIIEAWFTPEIPVSAGPELFAGLPGMILVLSIDEDRVVYAAKDINLDGLDEKAIQAPKKGKKMTRAEFDDMMEEKMAEMQAQYGSRRGSGASFIIRQN